MPSAKIRVGSTRRTFPLPQLDSYIHPRCLDQGGNALGQAVGLECLGIARKVRYLRFQVAQQVSK